MSRCFSPDRGNSKRVQNRVWGVEGGKMQLQEKSRAPPFLAPRPVLRKAQNIGKAAKGTDLGQKGKSRTLGMQCEFSRTLSKL